MTLKSIAVNKRGTRLQIARFHSAIGKKGKTIRTKSDHWFPVAGLGGEVLSLKNRRNINVDLYPHTFLKADRTYSNSNRRE